MNNTNTRKHNIENFRYQVLQRLDDNQNAVLGVCAGVIEGKRRRLRTPRTRITHTYSYSNRDTTPYVLEKYETTRSTIHC